MARPIYCQLVYKITLPISNSYKYFQALHIIFNYNTNIKKILDKVKQC